MKYISPRLSTQPNRQERGVAVDYRYKIMYMFFCSLKNLIFVKCSGVNAHCSQNIFAYGFPHKGRGFEQRAEQRTFEETVYYTPLILTLLPHSDSRFLRKFP